MSCCRRHAAWICLLLAACQPLPRPFQPEDKESLQALMRQVEVRPETEPTIVLGAVDGAPGDGDVLLAAAMRRALSEAGVHLRREPDDTTPVLVGAVHLVPAPGGMRQVQITWTLLRPSGEEIGRVGQADALPQAVVDGSWATLAEAIARAGAPGVLDLLEIAASSGRDGRVYTPEPRK